MGNEDNCPQNKTQVSFLLCFILGWAFFEGGAGGVGHRENIAIEIEFS